MLDLALTILVVVLLLLAGGVSIYSLAQTEEEAPVASTGTGAINLALICFSGFLLVGMILS